MDHNFDHPDIGDRQRAIRESIAAKWANRPQVDNHGRQTGDPSDDAA